MEEWIRGIVTADQIGFAFFSAVFLLGLLASVSSCCALPAIGAVVGFAGSRESQNNRRDLTLVGLFFLIGTTLSLSAIGAVSGLIGQVATSSLGKYWQLFAGLVLVFFGLVSLNLFPLKLPTFRYGYRTLSNSYLSAMVYGLVLGGATTACSVGCNPILSLAIGATAIKGSPLTSAFTFTIFGLGYSLPLAAALVGIGFGLNRLNTITARVMPVVRIGAGVLLIGTGFYLLATI